MRQQLARGLLWHDFGHDSDWGNPSSKSPISTKYGWEVGLLETVLGDDICVLARKPPRGEEGCIPYNYFATRVMHDKHKPMIRFVNGSVLICRVDKDVTLANQLSSPRSTLTFQSFDVPDFCAAYDKLSADVRAGMSLTTKGADSRNAWHPEESVRSTDSDGMVLLGGRGEFVETLVTPMGLTAAQADLDGWEWVDDAEFIEAGDREEEDTKPLGPACEDQEECVMLV